MSETPLHYMTITELAELIRSGELSPVEATQAQLDRIAKLDGHLKSYATVMADHAMLQARRAEQEIADGDYRGPLHGVPIAVKDLCFTTGVRTMGGSKVYADHVPSFDSTVVARFEAAGAVLLGKLNLTEGAMGGYNPELQIPLNPWDNDRWTGSSSSGSGSATAAGLCYGSLGSDTGGSIRFPAASCGIVGIKPTWGRVSRYGVLALAESLDHVGPMTRSVADAAVILQAIAGFDPNDPTSLSDPVPDYMDGIGAGIEGVRIGYDLNHISDSVDPELTQAVLNGIAVLRELGAEIVGDRDARHRQVSPRVAGAVLSRGRSCSSRKLPRPARGLRPVVPGMARHGRGQVRCRLRRGEQHARGVQRPREGSVQPTST